MLAANPLLTINLYHKVPVNLGTVLFEIIRSERHIHVSTGGGSCYEQLQVLFRFDQRTFQC